MQIYLCDTSTKRAGSWYFLSWLLTLFNFLLELSFKNDFIQLLPQKNLGIFIALTRIKTIMDINLCYYVIHILLVNCFTCLPFSFYSLHVNFQLINCDSKRNKQNVYKHSFINSYEINMQILLSGSGINCIIQRTKLDT